MFFLISTRSPVLTAPHFGNLFFGNQVHGHASKLAFSADHCVISALLDLYGRLDSIDSAKWVFVKSVKSTSNSVCWTILARLYLMQNQRSPALDLFHQMVNLDAYVDRVALATAVGACRLLKSMQEGRKAHRIETKYRLEFDVLVSNSIDCGSFADARAIFDRMPSKDVISWTETIGLSVKNGSFNDGLKLSRQMIKSGIKPDALSFSSVLKAAHKLLCAKDNDGWYQVYLHFSESSRVL